MLQSVTVQSRTVCHGTAHVLWPTSVPLHTYPLHALSTPQPPILHPTQNAGQPIKRHKHLNQITTTYSPELLRSDLEISNCPFKTLPVRWLTCIIELPLPHHTYLGRHLCSVADRYLARSPFSSFFFFLRSLFSTLPAASSLFSSQ